MIEGKGQKWALENIQVRCLIYNSLPWVTLFLVSGWAQSRFAYIQQWSPLILDPSIVLGTEDTSTPVFDSRSNQTSSNQSHTSSTHHRRKPQPSMDFPTTSLNVDPNVGSMFGTMFAQDVNWCDRELFVHFEIRALTFKSKIISKKSLQTQEQLLQIARWDERDGNLCERCHQAFGENCVMWICDTMAHVDCIDFSKFLLCWTTLLDIGCILYRR